MCTRILMTTKTITIMEDAYHLLVDNKLSNESFSDELRRVLNKKKSKSLSDFFGILPKEEGEKLSGFIEKRRELNLNRASRRMSAFK